MIGNTNAYSLSSVVSHFRARDFGIDPRVLDRMALEIGQLVGIGVQVGLVIGGGNLFRGAQLSEAGLDRVTGDHMGMLATTMNALAMRDA